MTGQVEGTLIFSFGPTAAILPLRIRTVPFSMGAAVGEVYIRAPTNARLEWVVLR